MDRILQIDFKDVLSRYYLNAFLHVFIMYPSLMGKQHSFIASVSSPRGKSLVYFYPHEAMQAKVSVAPEVHTV